MLVLRLSLLIPANAVAIQLDCHALLLLLLHLPPTLLLPLLSPLTLPHLLPRVLAVACRTHLHHYQPLLLSVDAV